MTKISTPSRHSDSSATKILTFIIEECLNFMPSVIIYPPTDPLRIPQTFGFTTVMSPGLLPQRRMNYTASSHLFLFKNPAESCCVAQKR